MSGLGSLRAGGSMARTDVRAPSQPAYAWARERLVCRAGYLNRVVACSLVHSARLGSTTLQFSGNILS